MNVFLASVLFCGAITLALYFIACWWTDLDQKPCGQPAAEKWWRCPWKD